MKIGLISLGCPKNLVDSEVMLGLAREAGHELTPDASAADVLVVNTCAFIDAAKRESVDAILEMAQKKKDGGNRQRLVVTGCLAERYRDQLKTEIPEIDAVLGTGEVPRIVEAIAGGAALSAIAPLTFHRAPGTSHVTLSTSHVALSTPHVALTTSHVALSTSHVALSTSHVALSTSHVAPSTSHVALSTSHAARRTSHSAPDYIYDADTPRVFTTPRHYAYIKIAEGCDYKCAFCIIPTLRGHYRSRPAESIVREARMLAEQGIKELLLISQDTTFYGIDRDERGALPGLLRQLNTVDGLEWIRLLYLYPTTIDDRTLDAMAESDKVCKYIDLPLQHASNPVLKRMKRPGTRQHYESLLARIRARIPNVALRTTFIVGFPGETEKDVEALRSFVTEQAFEHVGVFTYSHEEGTSAFELEDDVPAGVKRTRRNTIMGLQKRVAAARQRERIGTRAHILIDGRAADHDLVLKGRLATQAPDIDACVYLTECDPTAHRPGDLLEVEILGARDYDLIARPVS